MAFYYKTDNLNLWINDYIIIKNHFKNNLDLSILKDLLVKVGENISDELFEKSTTNARQLNLGKSIEFRKFESIRITCYKNGK